VSILGIDIGGTKTTIAIADPDGRMLGKQVLGTARDAGPQVIIESISEQVHALYRSLGVPENIEGIGISCGGPLDPDRGRIAFVPNIPGWEDLALADIISDKLCAPAWLDNDATLAAFGEVVFGAGRGVMNLVYFQVSTGIGGGIIIGGKPYRGCGNAGEVGHHKILPDGPSCTCGSSGCLEALSSGTSIAREARSALANNTESLLYRWTGGESGGVTAEMVARAAAEGDGYAASVWERAMFYLGIGVSNIVSILNPELVILGGGVTRSWRQVYEPVRRIVDERTMSELARCVRILPPALGEDAPVTGAIALVMEKLGKI